MDAIEGTWKDGQIVLDGPTDWPEGCRVLVEPVPEPDKLGISEREWPTTPQALAEWLQWFDALEPVELTPDDEAAWQAWRQKTKDYSVARMPRRIEGLFE